MAANLKLVGAVAIKVRPDASKFREELQKELTKELAGYSKEVEVKAKVKADTTEMKTDVEKAKKEAEAKKMTLKVHLDYDSVHAAEKQLESAVKKLNAVPVKVTLDEKGIEQARGELDDMKNHAQIEISYVQDEKGFKEVLAKIAEIRRHKLIEDIEFGWSEEELQAKEAEMQAALNDSLVMKIHYGNDRDSIERMLAEVNSELAKIKEIKFDSKLDEDSLKTTKEILQNELKRTPVEIRVNYKDQDSLKAARSRLKAMLTQIGEEPLKVNFNEKDLRKQLRRINGMIKEELAPAAVIDTTVKIRYNTNHDSLQKAIAEVDAELQKISAVEISVEPNPLNLAFVRARLEAELAHQKVTLEYDNNESGLQAAKAKLEALLHINKIQIETRVDQASLNEQLQWVNARLKEAERNKLKVKPEMATADYLKTMAAIKILTKDQTIHIFTKMNNVGLLLAAAKLTGLRAASRWSEEFARSLGTLDRNLPIVAGAVIGLSTLASGVLSLTANVFSLGNGLGEVVRMAALLAPAMVLGLGATMAVFMGVFKDFGAAVNGDAKALKALAPAGRAASVEVRKVFQEMRQLISKNFWDKASDGMLRFTKTALPSIARGLGGLSTSLGGVFSNLLDSFVKLDKQSGIKTFFTNLNHGFDLAQTGLADFMSGFNTLAIVGSTLFPRMGRAFNDFAAKFDSWVQRLAADGTLQRWIDLGIQGMKDLWDAGVSLTKVWGNIGRAAQASGALTLHSFAQMLDRWDVITGGSRFQENMKRIFQGAREATQSFHEALGNLGPEMDVFSVTVKNTLANSGRALGAFIADIGDIISSPRVNTGMQAFLGGIESMFVSLRPAAADIALILQNFGEILGKVATDSGPLFRTLFHQLSEVLDTAWRSLEPFLPALIEVGTTVIDILGPALSEAAQSVIPAFATAIRDLGTGLLPIILFLADTAAGAAKFVSALPIPVLAGMAAWVLSLSTAFRAAATLAPLAGLAMQFFGVQAAVAAVRAQLLVPVIGLALAGLTALIGFGVGALATSQREAAPYASQYADALMEDARAAGHFSDAIGEATTKVALKNLLDSGAYEAAQKLGIGTDTVTDAVLNGGKAWDEIQGKISEANRIYDENFKATQKANAGATSWGGTVAGTLTPAMAENRDAGNALNRMLGEQKASIDKGRLANKIYADAAKQAGINIFDEATAAKSLGAQSDKTAKQLGIAAAASTTLLDTFSSGPAKIDAMRKSLDILLPTSTKQKTAEALGAYVKGFNDIRDTVKPLAAEMQALGEKVYGDDGFLNVASGNKAVLQVNQALVDQTNNIWLGAKTAYDAAIAQGKTAKQAFQESRDFIDKHRKDYDQLATDSGVASDRVAAQWDAVFGHEWVLKVTLEGATEAAAKAQNMITILGGQFDGKKFQALIDADPTLALLAIKDPTAAAEYFVNKEWQAKLKALPKEAQDTLRELTGMTEEEWNRGDFSATLEVAKHIPGLEAALVQLFTGAKGPYVAQFRAALDGGSLSYVQYILDKMTNPRIVTFKINYDDSARDAAMAGRGGRNGAIVTGSGRGMYGFDLERVKFYANGGIENHVAQITKPGGPVRVWAEKETQGEAYVPYALSKRPRSVAILAQVAKDFGYTLAKTQYANGGTSGVSSPSTHNTASVSIGTLVTTDADAAVRKIRLSQLDALAVAGISLNGA